MKSGVTYTRKLQKIERRARDRDHQGCTRPLPGWRRSNCGQRQTDGRQHGEKGELSGAGVRRDQSRSSEGASETSTTHRGRRGLHARAESDAVEITVASSSDQVSLGSLRTGALSIRAMIGDAACRKAHPTVAAARVFRGRCFRGRISAATARSGGSGRAGGISQASVASMG